MKEALGQKKVERSRDLLAQEDQMAEGLDKTKLKTGHMGHNFSRKDKFLLEQVMMGLSE